jgi:hypothetical protein
MAELLAADRGAEHLIAHDRGEILMSFISAHRILAAGSLLALSALLPLHAQTAPPGAPDAGLYTTYTAYTSSGGITLNFSVCGSTQQSSGCYGGGSIGPFVAVSAMLEGAPTIAGNVVTRAIYVVDSANVAGVTLYVYKKTDTVSASYDTTTVTLAHTVSLPLVGGTSVKTYMAGNNAFLFIGTSQSTQAVRVNKNSLATASVGGFSPPANVSAIAADGYGNVTLTQGNGFYTYGPNGSLQEDGGGADFMVDTVQGIVPPASSSNSNAQSKPRFGYRLKTFTQNAAQ